MGVGFGLTVETSLWLTGIGSPTLNVDGTVMLCRLGSWAEEKGESKRDFLIVNVT